MKPNKPRRLRNRNPTVVDVLRRAVEFLEWGKWIRGDFAVDQDGDSCDADSPEACGYCAKGAIEAVGVSYELELSVTFALLRAIDMVSIYRWNDRVAKSKREVIRAFRKAIREEEKRHATD